jgi:3-methyl-2-oxobutanoate hydroxymethyltransferase
MKPWTTSKIRAAKGQTKLACLTAYDALTARLVDAAGVPLILVGDSLATTALGYETTLPMTMDVMLHHTAAVARATKQALVVADMPFLSYQLSIEQAIRNAGRFLQEAGADAVKLEGGTLRVETIAALVGNGIPVMAHIGVLPQSVREAGYRSRGSSEQEATRLKEDAVAVAEAGAFSVVLECVSAPLAAAITRALPIPTIGIGAGAACDGQILVLADLLGLTPDPAPRFVRRFARLDAAIAEAVGAYRAAVTDGTYPSSEHTYP